ncbi:MAG: glycosyltransferase family 2 protein [Bryobacterales bacterium]|nr:glycosyltransferase family 2 protein [Bryobacterales bacterium]
MEQDHQLGRESGIVAGETAGSPAGDPGLSPGRVPRISVVVPVKDERETVAELASRVRTQLAGYPHEILFIDDGSTDGTWGELERIHVPGVVRIVKFRRNFGKTAALKAGFNLVRGDIVFTMDGDLQDDPAEIPRFLAKLNEGYDLVSGWKKRRHDPASKVLPSRIFNRVVSAATGLRVHDVNCGFKCYRREVTQSLRLHGEMHRFMPVLAHTHGFRFAEIVVTHHKRRFGKSKYGFLRLFKGFFDLFTVLLLTKFSDRPAHAFGFPATILLLLSGVAALACALTAGNLLWAIASATLFLASFSAFCLGWVAEMIVTTGEFNNAFYSIEAVRD